VHSTGFFAMRTVCGRCGGRGKIVTTACATCGGEGRVESPTEIEVDVPPGIEDGTRIRIAGEGETESPEGPRGDLYCHVRVEEHPFFMRHGDDLVCEVPITYAQAALGARVEVPTLEGTDTLKVPRGTQSGEILRLRGRGIPNIRTGRPGDLLAKVLVEIPRKLSDAQEKLLRQLAEVEEAQVSPKRKSFLDWLKEHLAPK
jgi:molecular chaperone DnaJ